MKSYVLTGKIAERTYDSILKDIDKGKNPKITVGLGLSCEDINKIASLDLPIHVRGENWNRELSNTTVLLHQNSSECVLIDFLVTKNSIKRIYEVVEELINNAHLFGTKLLLREWPLDFLRIHAEEWNRLIVSCLDHGIEMCWDSDKFAATHRYEDYFRNIT